MRFEIALQLNSANTAELFKALQMLSPHFDSETQKFGAALELGGTALWSLFLALY